MLSKLTRVRGWIVVVILAAVILMGVSAAVAKGAPDSGLEVQTGLLVYAQGKTGQCFSSSFLTQLARVTQINVKREFETVSLEDEAVFEYPFIVMSGTGGFELSVAELKNLKLYLQQGGMLLGSAACSDTAWAASFESLIEQAFGQNKLQPIPMDHPVFHMVYDIQQIRARKSSGDVFLYSLEIAGRLAMVYSPVGLNDTDSAGNGCCCCGGNELRNARQINTNILAYALTH